MKNLIGKVTGILLIALFSAVFIPGRAMAAPKTMADGTVFDAQYYAASNPDVVAVFGTSEAMLYYHYSLCGKLEGRLPAAPGGNTQASAGFDAAYYAARYPDVKAAFGNNASALLAHYNAFGKAEGRFANALEEQAAINQLTALTASTVPQVTVSNDYAHQVFDLVNAERAKAGVAPLVWCDSLNNAVSIRAQEISVSFSHTRPNGSSCFTAISDVPHSYAGENIAAGQSTPASVMNSWMNSTGHRNNILNSNYNGMAVGYYKANTGYGSYWVQMFIKTR